MHRTSLIVLMVLFPRAVASAADPVMATVETTLTTGAGQIRQFAFDGDPTTCFVSEKDATAADHFTLLLDRPVAVKSIEVPTGRPGGKARLDAGILEVSADGKAFEKLATFTEGSARAKPEGRMVLALRIKPTADLKNP